MSNMHAWVHHFKILNVESDSSTSKRRKLERAGSGKSMQPAFKLKRRGSVLSSIAVAESGKSANLTMTEPQCGLPTDGGAGGPSVDAPLRGVLHMSE
jgi:hypothetical protein